MTWTLLILLACVAVAVVLRKHPRVQRALAWLWSVRNEWLAVPLAVIIFFISGAVLRAIDPNAGTFNVGVLQVLFVSAIQLLVAMTTAQVATAISYRRLWRPLKNQPVCRTRYVALYALYFLAVVWLMASL